MSSIDKLALTSRLLYDQRVLEQRKEIEMLKVKLFFRDYTTDYLDKAMKRLNCLHTRCTCSGCKKTGRMFIGDTEDKYAECTFGPWLDNVLEEHGLVTLHMQDCEDINFTGLYNDDFGTKREDFVLKYDFCDEDFHLVETSDQYIRRGVEYHLRWENVNIGRRLWNVESIDNPWIKKFERVFGESGKRLSSPPTPPPELA
jgi:hypothetical protein